MHWSTRVFLVLLRLVIGWHFLFEGLEKLESPTWSSEPYLRESVGPAALVNRKLVGDSVADRLTPRDGTSPRERLPLDLHRDWQAYFDAFAKHYELTDEQKQQAQIKFEQREADSADHLLRGGTLRKVKRVAPSGTAVDVETSTADRLREYLEKRQQLWDIQDRELPLFRTGAEANLRMVRAESERLWNELRTDINEQNAEFKKALASVLTAEQQKQEPLAEPVERRWLERNPLQRIDWLTRWSLAIIGGALILGALARTASIAGALFLLLVVAAIPPLPWLPRDIQIQGYKNIVEMLALLTLATTPSGRWVGVDGLIRFLNPFRWRRRAAVESPVERTPVPPSQPRPQPASRPTAAATTQKPRSWRD